MPTSFLEDAMSDPVEDGLVTRAFFGVVSLPDGEPGIASDRVRTLDTESHK